MAEQWVHLHCGLGERKHIKQMGEAMPLYIYLLTKANRKTGIILRKRKTITKETGLSLRKIQYDLNKLRKHGYIITKRRRYSLIIQITNWKGLPDYRETKKRFNKMVKELSGEMGKGLHF